MKRDCQLLIVGDSITLGVAEILGDEVLSRVHTTYVQHLSRHLSDVAIAADAALYRTTANVCQTIDSLLDCYKPDIVLLMIGGNDADVDWKRFILSEGRVVRSRVPVERYGENLALLAAQVLAAGACPVLTDFPRHNLAIRGAYLSHLAGRDLLPLIEQAGGQAESDRQLGQYRQAAATIARQNSIELVAYGVALDACEAQVVLGADGAHPNDVGHVVIAREVAPAILRSSQTCHKMARRLNT